MILAFPPAVPLLEATEVHLVKPKVRSPIPGPPCLIRTDNEVAPPFELSMGLPPIRPHGAIDLTQLRRLQAS